MGRKFQAGDGRNKFRIPRRSNQNDYLYAEAFLYLGFLT